MTLRFTDNPLSGSGDAGLDLWVFEVGPEIENTFVEISSDGLAWASVGMIGGATSGIDIDLFGYGTQDFFSRVRLTDDPSQGGTSGVGVGADIDSVGAISSGDAIASLSTPATVFMMCLGVLVISGRLFQFA